MSTTATTRTESFTDVSTLIVRNEVGNITIRSRTTDGTAHLYLSAHGAVDVESATVRCDDGVLEVDLSELLAEDGRGFRFQLGPISLSSGARRVDVEVDLPHDADIKAITKSGDIIVSGDSGSINAKTGSGTIAFENAEQVRLSTGSGDISGSSCRGGTVSTGSGDVDLGEVTGASLETRAGSGSITVRHTLLEQFSASTGAGDISLHLGQGSLAAKSGSGSIDVVVPQGIAVWLDLASGMGRVSKDIDSVGAPEEGQPHLSIKAKSGVGSIRIHH
ncbi:MAG: DUF4097 family beta strand repeat-containing protein [Actinomycetia bacterium]|nr:DUF4097 family beta strand repeat-containing protein [Actinomycetes bacterium]